MSQQVGVDIGGTQDIEGELVTFTEREAVVGTPAWRAKEDRYVRSVED